MQVRAYASYRYWNFPVDRPSVALGLIWCLGLAAFWPALTGPWLFDDVKLQDLIAAAHHGLASLGTAGGREELFLGAFGIGRPLAMATFALNSLFGQSPFGFKLVNLLLHLTTATVVYSLVRRLLSLYRSPTQAGTAALVVALLWALHPLQVSTVAYVVQRMTILSALFSFSALLSYVRLRMTETVGGKPPSVWSLTLPLLALPLLAVLSKENGALIPVYLLLLEVTVFRFQCGGSTRRWLFGYFGLVIGVGGAVAAFLVVPDALDGRSYIGRPFDLAQRLLTEFRMVTMYVGQVLLPRLSDMPFYYDGAAPSTGWLKPPQTLAAAGFLAGLLGLGLGLIRRRPLAAFGILLFFAGHLIESTIVPLELAFEHRNYLPSLGLILATVDLALAAGGSFAKFRPGLAAIATLGVLLLCMLRASAWSSAEQIDLTALHWSNPSLRARSNLAQTLTDAGHIRAAYAVLAGGRGIGARLQEGYLDCRETGHIDPRRIAAAQSEIGSFLSDYDASGIMILVGMAVQHSCRIPLRPLLDLVEETADHPNIDGTTRQKLLMDVGHLKRSLDDPKGAAAALEAAYRACPQNPLPLLLSALWQLDTGRISNARALYTRARAVGSPGRLDLKERFAEVAQRLKGESARDRSFPRR